MQGCCVSTWWPRECYKCRALLHKCEALLRKHRFLYKGLLQLLQKTLYVAARAGAEVAGAEGRKRERGSASTGPQKTLVKKPVFSQKSLTLVVLALYLRSRSRGSVLALQGQEM